MPTTSSPTTPTTTTTTSFKPDPLEGDIHHNGVRGDFVATCFEGAYDYTDDTCDCNLNTCIGDYSLWQTLEGKCSVAWCSVYLCVFKL